MPEYYLFIKMELCGSCEVCEPDAPRTLSKWLQRKKTEYDRLPVEERKKKFSYSRHQILELFAQIVSAVAYIHKKGRIHCDLKPDNIFVDPGDQRKLKLGDLGEMQPFAEGQPVNHVQPVVGTTGYMSPEMRSGRAYDRQTDIYSLGVIFFQLLSITVNSETVMAQPADHSMRSWTEESSRLDAIAREKAQDDTYWNDKPWSHPYDRILLRRMLAKEPADRPTADDLRWHEGVKLTGAEPSCSLAENTPAESISSPRITNMPNGFASMLSSIPALQQILPIAKLINPNETTNGSLNNAFQIMQRNPQLVARSMEIAKRLFNGTSGIPRTNTANGQSTQPVDFGHGSNDRIVAENLAAHPSLIDIVAANDPISRDLLSLIGPGNANISQQALIGNVMQFLNSNPDLAQAYRDIYTDRIAGSQSVENDAVDDGLMEDFTNNPDHYRILLESNPAYKELAAAFPGSMSDEFLRRTLQNIKQETVLRRAILALQPAWQQLSQDVRRLLYTKSKEINGGPDDILVALIISDPSLTSFVERFPLLRNAVKDLRVVLELLVRLRSSSRSDQPDSSGLWVGETILETAPEVFREMVLETPMVRGYLQEHAENRSTIFNIYTLRSIMKSLKDQKSDKRSQGNKDQLNSDAAMD